MGDPSDPVALERRLTRLEQQAIAAAEALAKQAIIYEARLAGLNESRQYEKDAIARMVPRGEYQITMDELNTWRRTVDSERSRGTGERAVLASLWGIAVVLASFATRFIQFGA